MNIVTKKQIPPFEYEKMPINVSFQINLTTEGRTRIQELAKERNFKGIFIVQEFLQQELQAISSTHIERLLGE